MEEHQSAKRLKLKATGIVLFGLAPAILSVFLTQASPAARPISGKIERSPLVFSQYSVQLGEVRPVGTVPAHFDFFNAGKAPIEILKLDPSCGCLAPRLYGEKKIYQPGEHGRFYVSVKTANETPGPKEYTVKVNYNDGAPQESLVSFKLTVPEKKVSVTPSEVYFYQTQGKADSREIVVEDHRGLHLNVLDIEHTSEKAEVTLLEKIIEGSTSRTPIRINVPGDVPPGRHVSLITIHTDDSEYHTIKIPVLVWGPKATIQQASAEEIETQPASTNILK